MNWLWGSLIAVAVGIVVGVSLFMYVLFLARDGEKEDSAGCKDESVAEFIRGVLGRVSYGPYNEAEVMRRMRALCNSLQSLDGYAQSNKMAEGVLDGWLGSYGALLKKAVDVYCSILYWDDGELERPIMVEIIDTVNNETQGILSRLSDAAEKGISASTADLLGKIAANRGGSVKMVEAAK